MITDSPTKGMFLFFRPWTDYENCAWLQLLLLLGGRGLRWACVARYLLRRLSEEGSSPVGAKAGFRP
jgi:hypothetical protein